MRRSAAIGVGLRYALPACAALAGSVLMVSCNVALGGGAAALVGGSAVLASQCYDRLHISVRDVAGNPTCKAQVSVLDAEGTASRLQPCYTANLTEGTYRIVAKQQGFADATTVVSISEHDGCPYYTHSIELTLRPLGAPALATTVGGEGSQRNAKAAAAPATPAPAPEAASAAPPTRAFDLLAPPPEPAPAAPAPAPAPAAPAAPAAPPAPAPVPPEPL